MKNSSHHRRATSRIASIRHALHGISILLVSQENARIHLITTISTIALGIFLEISVPEWIVIVLAISLVWVAEGLNTAIEFIVDMISPEHRPLAGQIKDLAAGSVFLAAIGALTIGLAIFGPRLYRLISPL